MTKMTPHAVSFVVSDDNKIVIPPSGDIARVSAKTVNTGKLINGIPVTRTVYGDVENLPDPQDDTIYIVSSLVAARVPNRDDVFIPNESVRDAEGRIIGCRSLGRV